MTVFEITLVLTFVMLAMIGALALLRSVVRYVVGSDESCDVGLDILDVSRTSTSSSTSTRATNPRRVN